MPVPFIPATGVAQVEMLYTQDGQFVENVYHVWTSGSWSSSTLTSLATVFRDWWYVYMRGTVAAVVTLRKIRLTDLTSQTATMVEYVDGLPISATAGGSAMPNSVTYAVKWLTASRGRSYRGRTFHIGLVESQVTGNRLNQGELINHQVYYTTLLSAVSSAGFQMVVLSRRSNGAWRSAGVATPITGVDIDPVIDSQRRRLPDRGR